MDKQLLGRILVGVILILTPFLIIFSRDNELILNKHTLLILYLVFLPLGSWGAYKLFSKAKKFHPILRSILSLFAGIMLVYFVSNLCLGLGMDIFNKNAFVMDTQVTKLNNEDLFFGVFKSRIQVGDTTQWPRMWLCIKKGFGLPAIDISEELKPGDKIILIGRESFIGVVIDRIKKVH